MDILKKINEDLIVSMKSKEEGSDLRTTTLRMMKSSIKNAEIAKRGKGDLTEDDITGVLSTMVKQRKESAEQYEKANRKDLADKENKEINIIRKYLPEQMKPEELDEIIKSTIKDTGVAGAKEMGKLVTQRVKEILEKLEP